MENKSGAASERRRESPKGNFILNKIFVCVDAKSGNEILGRVYHGDRPEVYSFLGVDQLLLMMESFLDKQNFPAASTESRYFMKPKEDIMSAENEWKIDNNRNKGKRATFVVQVQYRQNSTWQGNVKWLEKDIERPFMSALELIKLLDSSGEEDAK